VTRSEPRRDAGIAAAVFAALTALFWLGRSRSFGMGDSPQHVLSALLWAVPHPPGYPLQTALGWLWSRLPWSDAGAAVNGLSGIFSAAAAAALFLLLRLGGVRRAAALIAAAAMALSPLFWYYALVAEVRALNDLLALCAACFAFAWSRDGKPAHLLAFAASFGLGLSHHPTFVFLVPAYAAWLSARRPPAKLAAGALALAALGLAAPYLLLGLRLSLGAPAYNLFEVRGWGDLWPLFTRARLGGPLRMAGGAPLLGSLDFDLGALAAHAGWLLSSLWTHGGPVALALSALGAAALWKESRRDLAAWALWFAGAAGIFLVFSSQQMPVVDAEYARAVAARFHLLPLLAVFALAGFGAEALARRARPASVYALLAAVVAAPLLLRPLSLSRQDPLLDHARAMIRDSAPGDFIVLGGDDTIFAALDLELVRGEGGGRVFLCPTMFSFPPYLRRLKAAYPGVVLPDGPRGPGTDWAAWKKLNPGRAVLVEPSLRDAVLADFPESVPQGAFVRVESSRVKTDPAADARRFLDAPETSSFTRRDAREWTQEVYLLQSRRRMAEWLASRLNPERDAEPLQRLILLMEAL
jgi:4-amino-4-deoxy-L-arabinose transferase-like glycosyltransferase